MRHHHSTTIQTRVMESAPSSRAHDLIVAIARKRRTQPQEQEQEDEDLEAQPEKLGAMSKSAAAAALWQIAVEGLSQPPKKNTDVRAEIRIMFAYSARKKSAKAMPEYSHESRDDFGLPFRHVKGRPVGLGETGDEIHGDERQQPEPVPGECAAMLGAHDGAEIQAAETMSTPTSAKPMAICRRRFEPRSASRLKMRTSNWRPSRRG